MEGELDDCRKSPKQRVAMAPRIICMKPGVETVIDECFMCNSLYSTEFGRREFRKMVEGIFLVSSRLMDVSEADISVTALMYAIETKIRYDIEIGTCCLIIASKALSDNYIDISQVTHKYKREFATHERKILRGIRYKCTRYTFLQFVYEVARKEGIELPNYYTMEKYVAGFCKQYGPIIMYPVIAAVVFAMCCKKWMQMEEDAERKRVEKWKTTPNQTVTTPEDKLAPMLSFLPGVWVPGEPICPAN